MPNYNGAMPYEINLTKEVDSSIGPVKMTYEDYWDDERGYAGINLKFYNTKGELCNTCFIPYANTTDSGFMSSGMVNQLNTYVSQLIAHKNSTGNVHGLTLKELGVESIGDIGDINLQTITCDDDDVPSKVTDLADGDYVRVAWGKIRRLISAVTDHTDDTDIHVTTDEKDAWSAKAEAVHQHSISDIDGTVPVSKGGTGVSTAEEARTVLMGDVPYVTFCGIEQHAIKDSDATLYNWHVTKYSNGFAEMNVLISVTGSTSTTESHYIHTLGSIKWPYEFEITEDTMYPRMHVSVVQDGSDGSNSTSFVYPVMKGVETALMSPTIGALAFSSKSSSSNKWYYTIFVCGYIKEED